MNECSGGINLPLAFMGLVARFGFEFRQDLRFEFPGSPGLAVRGSWSSAGTALEVELALRAPTSMVVRGLSIGVEIGGEQLRFVLPTELGHVELFDDVPDEDVRAVLSQ